MRCCGGVLRDTVASADRQSLFPFCGSVGCGSLAEYFVRFDVDNVVVSNVSDRNVNFILLNRNIVQHTYYEKRIFIYWM